ncbi:MAG: LacI family DNA-binding transcriptional regulator, partial [Luteolibacter sp.]
MPDPTMADVARASGVSKNTVSLALRGSPRVAGETLRRIVETAEAMGYRLN